VVSGLGAPGDLLDLRDDSVDGGHVLSPSVSIAYGNRTSH
jgi:hypothetical protein